MKSPADVVMDIVGGRDVHRAHRYVIAVYVLTGVVAGLAGGLLTARTGSGQPISGSDGLGLESITAAALGGAAHAAARARS